VRWATAALCLFGVLLVACSGSSVSSDNPWMLDATSRPEQAILLQTTYNDPQFEDYVLNPIYTYDAGGLTGDQILDWYRENMSGDGWILNPWNSGDGQVAFHRRGPRHLHTLLVITGRRSDSVDGLIDEYTVEEFEAE
jgi:hypothetical protein